MLLLILGSVCRLFPKMYDALAIVRPDTVVRWHLAGFGSYWRWKSRRRCGRPTVPLEIRRQIREMSIANPLWGAPRIHGELLKLGIDIGQTSVAEYMTRRRGSPSQGWKTFLCNHADGITAMDLFVVPTMSFRLIYGLLIMGHGRRQILWIGVTALRPLNGWQIRSGRLTAGASSAVSHPRPGWDLRRDLHSTATIHGNSRSSDLRSLTLAKRIRRKADRLDPQGMR